LEIKIRNLDRHFFLSILAILIYGASPILSESIKWIQIPLLLWIGFLSIRKSVKASALSFSAVAICLLSLWPPLKDLWPAPSLLVCAIVGVALWFKKDLLLKNQFQQVRRKEWILSIFIGLLSAAGVLIWFWLYHPTSDEIIFKFPALPAAALFPAVIAISALNAFAEELLFRGLAFDAISEGGQNERFANIGLAFAFGIFHFKGFPFGFAGSILAFVFGYLMGFLRMKSKGLLLPWVAHFTADLCIMMILLNI
jgi:hypothetical protein